MTTLAAVGFIALIGASIWLASYSTRFVPGIVNRVGSAAVYLGSLFQSAPATLSVVPTPLASTTLPFATSTLPVATTTPVVKPPLVTKPTYPTTSGPKAVTTYPMNNPPVAPTLSGYPDLVVSITAVGYLATTSADSFVASSTVPQSSRPAVRFTIKNVGTNIAGPWRFSASIPTQNAFIFESQPQQRLAPGESIDYVLGFDQANKGASQMISVTANFDKAITESNATNNSAAASLTILGS